MWRILDTDASYSSISCSVNLNDLTESYSCSRSTLHSNPNPLSASPAVDPRSFKRAMLMADYVTSSAFGSEFQDTH